MNIYIVTRRVEGLPAGVYASPNLGVFRNRRKALEHFDNVIRDRQRYKGFQLRWNHEGCWRSPGDNLRMARMEYQEFGCNVTEELVVQQWTP